MGGTVANEPLFVQRPNVGLREDFKFRNFKNLEDIRQPGVSHVRLRRRALMLITVRYSMAVVTFASVLTCDELS